MDSFGDGAMEAVHPASERRAGGLSTGQRRAVVVGTVMLLCAAAAIVGLDSNNEGTVELEASWIHTFQKQRSSAAQTKQFLAAMSAGAAAAKDANQYLGSGESVKPARQAPQPLSALSAMGEQFPVSEPEPQEGVAEEEGSPESPASEGEAAAAPASEAGATEVSESPFAPGSSPTIMQPAPLPQEGVGLVESPVTPQQASAAYEEFQEAPPMSVQQPLTSAQVHVVSGMNQPARVVVQQQQQQQQPEYVLQRPMAAPMSGNAMPVRVMQPEEGGGQRYVMVPAYQERMGQEEEQEDACATGKRQSPISIEYNIVPKAMEVLGWEVTGGYQGQLRITNVEAMGADATILELVRGEASMTVGGVRYDLRSIHVHTPSEHAVGGQKFDLELQLLHTAPQANGEPEKQLVVSVLCHQYPESALILSTLAHKLSDLGLDQQGSVDLDLEQLALQVLGQTEQVSPTSTNAQSYFQYEGSLTTAPCSETATWIVLKNPLRVSLEDIGKISRVVLQPNRPLQPLNGRVVLDSHPVA